MSRAADAIRAGDGRWSPIGAKEVLEAARLAKEVACGKRTRETQALNAYMYLVSVRNSESLTAVASSAEVAAHVLTKRGDGTISEATYRRYTRNDLKLCGLVDFPSSKGGRDSATVYTFPAFMRLYGIVDNLPITANEHVSPCTGQPVQNVYNLYGLTRTNHAQKVASIELLEDRYMGMEGDSTYTPPESPLPVVDNPLKRQASNGAKEVYCGTCGKVTRFLSLGYQESIGQVMYECPHCGNKEFIE